MALQVLVAEIARNSACDVASVPVMPPEEEGVMHNLDRPVPPEVLPAGFIEGMLKPYIFNRKGQLVPPGTVGQLVLFPCKLGAAPTHCTAPRTALLGCLWVCWAALRSHPAGEGWLLSSADRAAALPALL